MGVRILVVDDHRMIRDGLRQCFSHEPDMEIVGEAANGHEAVALTGELLPDVVVMDITLPLMSGAEATAKIVELYPRTRVVALSMHADPYYVERMRQAGASGYVLKDDAFSLLAECIRQVQAGRKQFPSRR